MKRNLPILILLLAALLPGCATQQNHYDPIESTNRVTDKVNDGIDRITLKPAARGYTAVVPKPLRTAVSNFFDNATYMNTVLNDFLQGKGSQGMADLGRFLMNSSFGLAGLVDVATPMGLERHDEDFGQTLAVWGVGNSAYIVYPLLGPNSLRKTPDFVTATATDPLFWAGFVLAPYITVPVAIVKYVDKRARLLKASDMRDELALDPYVFTREAWMQQREYLIYDGHPPVKENSDDGWQDEDFDSEDSSSTQKAKPVTRVAATAGATQQEPVKAGHRQQPNDSRGSMQQSYIINLSSHYNEVEATAEQGRLTRLGLDTEIHAAIVRNHTWYRLRSVKHVPAANARQELQRIQDISGLKGGWLEPE
ncbi:MAG: VacJ family lipoprotein [Mariprofundus sp.]